MTPQEIFDSVPTDAPSSTAKPKNNLWSWSVGMLLIAAVTLWALTQSLSNSKYRDIVRAKDATIADKDTIIRQQREEIKGVRTELQQCNADKLIITDNNQKQLFDILDIKPGKRQTISISPKSTR